MTRVEAFEALFGDNANKTACKKAVDLLGNCPRPSREEADELDPDVLDRANDFADKPAFQVSRMPEGNAKTLLERLVRIQENKAVVAVEPNDPTKSLNKGDGKVQKVEIVGDPRQALLAAASAPSQADSKPQTAPERRQIGHATRDPEPEPEGEDMGRRNNWNRGDNDGNGQQNQHGQNHQNHGGKNQNGRGGKGNQGPPAPPLEASKPSTLKTTDIARQIILTERWRTDQASAEKLYEKIRNGDQTSIADVERWQRVLNKMICSDTVSVANQNHARYLLKLLANLRARLDVRDPPAYKEMFVDGLPPPPTPPTEIENAQQQGRAKPWFQQR